MHFDSIHAVTPVERNAMPLKCIGNALIQYYIREDKFTFVVKPK